MSKIYLKWNVGKNKYKKKIFIYRNKCHEDNIIIKFSINKKIDLIIENDKKKKYINYNIQEDNNNINLFGKNIKFNKVRDVDGIY